MIDKACDDLWLIKLESIYNDKSCDYIWLINLVTTYD